MLFYGWPIPTVLTLLIIFCNPLFAAGNIVTPGDTNSRITVENAVVRGNETTVFFLTWPDLGDPNSGKDCGLNYYSATLKPGLPSANPEVVAKGVCSGLLQKSAMLENGDALIIANDRLERWRAGEQIKSQRFSAIDAVSKLRVTSSNLGGQFFDISPGGDVVLAIPAGGFNQVDFPDASVVVTNLKPDGGQHWEIQLNDLGQHFTLKQVWAAWDGGALLYLENHSTQGMMPVSEPQLRFISALGQLKTISLLELEEQFDLESTRPGSEEDMQRFFEHQRNARPESIKALAATAREGGGIDVLLHREGGAEGREGHFLYRLAPDGSVQNEIALGNHIAEHGLEKWFDFYIENGRLVLLSRVLATQHGVNAKRKKWSQNAVSWINLETGMPDSRLIPLDRRYLEAAMNAGDAEMQYLDGLPDGDPVLLSTLGSKPLAVSVGWISKSQVLRLNEADEQLMAYTEAFDEKQAKLAKEASRAQRKADREARSAKMQAEMAAAAGMSEEEFAALSNRERKEALIRSGNTEMLMESAMREAQTAQAQQGIQAQSGASAQNVPQDMNAQIAAAMAQAQQQMANDPNMTPEMRAQMEAVMAQMGGAPGVAPSDMPASSPQAAPDSGDKEALPENTLSLDTGMRGFIEYENKDGRLITLLIFNRQTGEELLKKDYPDGVIYEYVDFGKFDLPLEQIGVIYREVAGMILEDLTPAIVE